MEPEEPRMTPSRPAPTLSVIVPVGRRHGDAALVHGEYKAGLEALGQPYELIYVLDGPLPEFEADLRQLNAAGERFTVVGLSRSFGEATAIMAGFGKAVGATILILPAHLQVKGSEIPKLVASLDGIDLVLGRRWPRAGGFFERFRRWAFHGLLARVTHLQYNDLACGAKAFRRQVLEEINIYGDQHRYLAILADRQGFRTRETALEQSPHDRNTTVYGPREYLRSVIDIFTVFFLVRFTKRPLRFFGMVGLTTFGAGVLWTAVLVVQRVAFERALADRPALLLSTLLVVLGLQVFALGLLGELIIFTHARNLKDYQVAEIISFPPQGDVSGGATS
jgi:glycosyltransferase involved in cell wall biosynthesis